MPSSLPFIEILVEKEYVLNHVGFHLHLDDIRALISVVLVECLGIRKLEEACCYLLACMDENQIPMVKTQLPVHLQEHFNKAL